jgi:hypothetical protein
MFDWPEQTQTSPTRTFLKVSVLRPATVNSNGPPALCGPTKTSQRPRASAVALALSPRNETVTRSPGSAQPQTRALRPCCKTMLSPMTDGTRTSARAAPARESSRKRNAARDFLSMFMGSLSVERMSPRSSAPAPARYVIFEFS